MVTSDDGAWFAQGLEIDFFAEGTSVSDVKRRFERSLSATIEDYLRTYGSIEKLLKPAPREVWKEFAKMASQPYLFSHLSIPSSRVAVREYEQRIEYYERPAA